MKLSIKVILVACALLAILGLSAACAGTKVATSNAPSAVTSTSQPSVFKIASLAVNPSEINAGVPILVTAKVTNTGGIDTSYRGNIRVDDATTPTLPTYLGSDTVTIPAGTTQLLSVPMTIKNPGTYKVSWDGVSQTLLVNPEDDSNLNNPQNTGPGTAPDFTAVDVVTGKTVSLKHYNGSIVLLNFVNYGCNPSTNQKVGAQLLAIKQLQSQRNDFVPLSVFCGCCPPDVLRQFAKDNNLNWPWVLDSDYSIAKKYANYLKSYGYPTLIFIDKDQLIREFSGYLDLSTLNTKLNSIATPEVKK